jgi:hypothetical protein
MCDECGTRFDKLHFDRAEPPPPCPGCAAISARQTVVPAGFAIGSTKSKAVDLCQDIVEKEYGMSNMRDNMREGDIAVISPPPIAQAADNFWSAGAKAAPAAMMSSAVSAAKVSAQISNAEGRNPVKMVQNSIKQSGRNPAKVLCRPVASTR